MAASERRNAMEILFPILAIMLTIGILVSIAVSANAVMPKYRDAAGAAVGIFVVVPLVVYIGMCGLLLLHGLAERAATVH
jgi:hypothetical protein